MPGAAPEQLEEEIRPTGFYRNKARSLQGMARILVENHDGEVPHYDARAGRPTRCGT